MGWAFLLRRVFDIDLEHCQQCGGELTIIAAIEESAVIVRILTHLGLPARAPPRAPARRLPLFETASSGRSDKSGCATGLMIRRGPRSPEAVKQRRSEAIRACEGLT